MTSSFQILHREPVFRLQKILELKGQSVWGLVVAPKPCRNSALSWVPVLAPLLSFLSPACHVALKAKTSLRCTLLGFSKSFWNEQHQLVEI
uniref:Uncharacterized protein n=1 Tax=Physcomitrium patens TaxID=3218 RepID=A0A2K1J0E5_PHYPA|nr:hypothetical protein PHYPA_022888 [Physcomitrium patens]